MTAPADSRVANIGWLLRSKKNVVRFNRADTNFKGIFVRETRNMRTLIADDDLTARTILQKVCSRYGECHTAVNGKEAVEEFQLARQTGRPYNLVCLDIMMPEMNGRDTLKRMRAIELEHDIVPAARAKIIMSTAVSDMDSVRESLQESANGYLLKPTDIDKLLHLLEDFGLAYQQS